MARPAGDSLRPIGTLGALLLLTTPAFAQGPAASELRGRVASKSEVALPNTEITIVGSGRSVLTDSTGWFVLRDVPPGEHVVRVRRIGFNAQVLSAKLAAGETKEVTIVLEPGTYQLPDIEVTARSVKPIEYAHTAKYDDFFRRRRVGLGRFITREEIEFRRPFRTPNLLTGIAGVRVRFYHLMPTGTDVEFVGCRRVSVWIDGWRQPSITRYPEPGPRGQPPSPRRAYRDSGALALGEMLERVLPSQIEMMEIYRGPAEMPAEFLDDSCAAIVIWTR